MTYTTFVRLIKSIRKTIFLSGILCFGVQSGVFSQEFRFDNRSGIDIALLEKCGYDSLASAALLQKLGPGWGYNYDSLLTDIDSWRTSPFVQIDSVGASLQNRALWVLTITDTAMAASPGWRVWIHARTHPNEVQAWWVTDEIINILLGDTPLARTLRQNCIFNIMPMYNPDGVELGHGRTNANGIDLERNWDKAILEPEVDILKQQFEKHMASTLPIRIQLNMHAAIACSRFFVYHHKNGTSAAYAEEEKKFIGGIASYWPEGIEDWNFRITWTNGTPTHFPESWFWLNFREAVMALTYEDMNCDDAGEYGRTADALLNGIADFLGIARNPTGILVSQSPDNRPADFTLFAFNPNPIRRNRVGQIRFQVNRPTDLRIVLYDLLGRKRLALEQTNERTGGHFLTLPTANLPSGRYFIKFQSRNDSATRGFTIVR